MQTKLRPGVDVPQYDQEIISVAERKARDGGIEPFVIGIRNRSGAIYRTVRTKGLSEYIDVNEGLKKLGFIDELAEAETMVDGCDSILRPFDH